MQPDDDKTQAVTVLSKGTVIGHYRIVEKIGAGGMGEVYLAEDAKLDRSVALKFLSPHLCQDEACRKRFEREAQAAAKLDHPNIVTVYEVGEFQGRPFFAMQHIEGRSLHEYSSHHELSISQVLEIGIQIAEGLQAAHEKGVTHRDIKPANVLIDSHGRARILDFGLASVAGVDHLTKTGSTLGTVGYMSPEQLGGETVDHRTDVFSLGVVLYELITGRQPFKGDSDAATSRNIIDLEPEPLARYKAEVSAEVQRIISKALIKDRNLRYQHADELAADLRGIAAKHQIMSPPPDQEPSRKRLRFAIPSSFLVIIVALLLILKPWRLVIEPTQEAVAGENRLAIMYFDNMADPADSSRLGEIIANLLITDLTESQYLRVVSSQRLYDILKLMGKEGVKRVDKAVATQVAEKAQAKWMLLGSILQVEPRMVVTTQLVEVKNGEVKKSQHITGEPKEDVFSLVDRLTTALRRDLSLPAQGAKEETPSVASVTTHSQEAYRCYLEARDYAGKLYYPEAEKSYRKALEYDSTFAMAYLGLFKIAWDRGTGEDKELLAKAAKYSEKASLKEKMYIQAFEAFASENTAHYIELLQKIVKRYPDEKLAYMNLGAIHYELGELEEAIRCYGKAIEIDSLYKSPYNALAYAYDKSGDFEKSIWAINKYISLAPGEARPYYTRGNLYAYNGKLDEAIVSYKKSLEIKPDFYMSLSMLGHMYLFKRDYAKAESCYKVLATASDQVTRQEGRTCLAYIPLFQGKFEQALQALDDGIAADKMEQITGEMRVKHFLKAIIYEEKKDLNLALSEIRKSMELMRKDDPNAILYWQDHYAYLLVENGDVTGGEEVSNSLKKDIEKKDPGNILSYNNYWYMVGRIEFAKGNLDTAITDFVQANKTYPCADVSFFLSDTYLKLGRVEEAVAELEKRLLRYDADRASTPIAAVKSYYLLGLAYEKSGWNKRAIEKYEEFLDIWKDADPGIKEVEDAKARLARLQASS